MPGAMPMAVAALLLSLSLLVLAGCKVETRVVRSGWDNLPIDPKPGQSGTAASAAAGQRYAWAIPLRHFMGPNRKAEADAMAKQLERDASLSPVWVEDTEGTATVYVGRFADPGSAEARSTLQRVRGTAVEGTYPFAEARLVPVTGGAEGYDDPLNLKQYTGFYTLQIGFYDEQFGGDFRKAAEKAARVLRDEGHEAYYYHGPHRSLVTVGLFTYAEAFVTRHDPLSPRGTVDAYSPAVRKLQEQFPYNLGNGVTLIEKRGEEVVGELPSFIVRVFY